MWMRVGRWWWWLGRGVEGAEDGEYRELEADEAEE